MNAPTNEKLVHRPAVARPWQLLGILASWQNHDDKGRLHLLLAGAFHSPLRIFQGQRVIGITKVTYDASSSERYQMAR